MLTDAKIRSLKPSLRPYKQYDRRGLFLKVYSTGVKLAISLPAIQSAGSPTCRCTAGCCLEQTLTNRTPWRLVHLLRSLTLDLRVSSTLSFHLPRI